MTQAESMAEAESAEFAAPYPKYLDWVRYVSAFLLFTYASSKMLGRQFMDMSRFAIDSGEENSYSLAGPPGALLYDAL
jgi:hypothetical protein